MRFIDEHRDRYAVALLLRVLNIKESTYYGWVEQAARPCEGDEVDLGLLSNIYEIWEASGRAYGADRVHQQLRRDGIRVGRKRVERLMAGQGWQGAFLRKKWRISSTTQDPRHTPAPDLVNRNFTTAAPNRLWVADATRIPCGEGVFWLAAVRDAFSDRIVGWKTSDRCDTDLILAALEYGIWSRDGQLIHHSDKGSNYTSFRFTQRLADNGILPSMGSTGDSYDNALMENFWSTLKIELVYRTAWRTRDEAENAIFAYIDGWYNTRRIQKDLGYRSPDEYEAAWHADHAAQPATTILTPTPTGAR
jgi:transposase InsO family protein